MNLIGVMLNVKRGDYSVGMGYGARSLLFCESLWVVLHAYEWSDLFMCHYKNTRENLTEMFKVVDVYNAERLQRVVDCAIVGLELDLTSVTSNQCMSRHCEKLILLVFSVGHVSVGHVLVASLHIRLAVALKKF